MKSLPLIGLAVVGIATLCFAASEPIVSLASLKEVEGLINDKLQSKINDPYDLLGAARGTYMEGYGAAFSFELNLVLVSPMNLTPFKPSVTEAEIATLHDRKAQRVNGLKDSMRGLMLSASKSLPGLPGNERIVMEAFLFNYRWENTRGIPRRVMLTAQKQKLIDAVNHRTAPSDLPALFTEEEL